MCAQSIFERPQKTLSDYEIVRESRKEDCIGLNQTLKVSETLKYVEKLAERL